MIRAHHHGIPVVLGSATPSLESLQRARAGDYRHLRLTRRASRHAPSRLELVDLRGRPRQGGLIAPVLDAITTTLNAGHQVLVFINRRGFAPTLACHACGWLAECTHCDAHMTLHRQPAMLACHHCDHRQGLPDACPDCGSADLRPLGSGTERTEETLAQRFPDLPVHRIDRDSTRRRDALERTLGEVRRGEPCLLVGTQMLAKGHHLPHVNLVVVVNADAGLYASDFRALEHSAQLLEQVAGRAGRASHPAASWCRPCIPTTPISSSWRTGDTTPWPNNCSRKGAPPACPLFAFWPCCDWRAHATATSTHSASESPRRPESISSNAAWTSTVSAPSPRPWSAARTATTCR